MELPKVELPKSSIDIGGTEVTFRSLSRSEALKVSTNFTDNPDDAETFILACGVDISLEDAAAWRQATDPKTAGSLIDAIIYLTGLADNPQ